jgi:hypothetical protein
MHVTNSLELPTYPLMFLMSRFPCSDNYWVRTCLFLSTLFLFTFSLHLLPTLSLFVSDTNTSYLCFLVATQAWSEKKAMWRIGVSGFAQIESWGEVMEHCRGDCRDSELGLDPVSRSRILSGRGVSYDEMDIKFRPVEI